MELNSVLHMWSLNALRLVREVTHEPIDISMWVYVINMNLFFGNDCVLWRIKKMWIEGVLSQRTWENPNFRTAH